MDERLTGPVLVTGAGGFVGRTLVDRLGADAVPTEVDVRDEAALVSALRESQAAAVVHLAAVSSVGESWSRPGETWHVNAVGTVNLLAGVAAERPDARVLFVSTGEVYGRAEQVPTPEDAPLAPLSPYAASKAAAELACDHAARAQRLDVVVARAFQQEGPGRDERFAIGSWARQLAELEQAGGGVLYVGDLRARRDITDVRDAVIAYRLLLERRVPAGVYNVSSGKTVSMQEVLDILVGLAGCPVEVQEDPARVRPAELPVVSGDPAKLRAATGWEPTIPLEQTLRDALHAAKLAVRRERIPSG